MIPLKLTVNNFLCYRDNVPTLDLEGVHVACLCGENGHGKSALLDAITWALWGKARGKSQDDLIHFGQSDMQVELEFLVQEAHYLVIRRHSRAGSRRRQGASDLQLQVQSGNDFQPLTGNTMRETQALLEKLIGMDYDTFINTAFLLQGRADEFTNKSPGERKEVLAKILGLDRYDQLQERAKERASATELEVSGIESKMGLMREELEQRGEYQRQLDEAIASLQDVNKRLEDSRERVDTARRRVEELKRRSLEKEGLEHSVEDGKQELDQLNGRISSLHTRIAEHEGVIAARGAIEEGYQRLQDTRQRQQSLNQALQRVNDLNNLRAPLAQRLHGERAKLEERCASLSRDAEQRLLPRVNAIPEVERRLKDTQQHQEKLALEEEALRDRRRRLQELDKVIGHYQALSQRLQGEGEELGSKLKLLDLSHDGARCPLCETELGEEGRQRLLHNYNNEIEEKRDQYRQNSDVLKAAEGEKAQLDREVAAEDVRLRRSLQEAQASVTSCQLEMKECLKARKELEEVKAELVLLEETLTREDFAPEERARLKQIDAEITSIAFAPKTLREADLEVQRLQPFEERYQRLQEAERDLSREREDLAQVHGMANRREQEIASGQRRLQELAQDIAQLPRQEAALAPLQSEYAALEQEQSHLLSLKGDLEGKLSRLNALEGQVRDLEQQSARLREEHGAFRELVEAFGRRGVQAMLIESILPRLEEEANTLLGRMTENRMHVKLETQRETKGGEVRETLDIYIADELGTRSYEMFSGGEAFRINLALRIALSKVLAERKGLPSLPTLFIDEGFGTQDTAGRERILDVIGAIEPDFQKILVITHLEDIKEAFPVRIEVEKTEAGSTFSMS